MSLCLGTTPTPSLPRKGEGGRVARPCQVPLLQRAEAGGRFARPCHMVSLPLAGKGQGWGVLMSTELSRKLRTNAIPAERAMWRILWAFRQQGWHFRRQVQIGAYYADFACLAAKLVIEVDGDTHGARAAIARDETRDAYMASRGMLVLRFTNADVMGNADGVFAEIAGVLGAVLRTTNTPTPALPARGREDALHGHATSSRSPLRGGDPRPGPPRKGEEDALHGHLTSSPSPLRGGDRGGGSAP